MRYLRRPVGVYGAYRFGCNITMKTDQEFIVETAINWLQSGFAVWWISLLKISGSAPQEIGAFMAIRGDGEVCGSLSGGCLEEYLVQRIVLNELPSISIQTLSADAEEKLSLMLPCGGSIDLLLEKLSSVASLQPLLRMRQAQQRMIRSVCLNTGRVQFMQNIPNGVNSENGDLVIFEKNQKVFQIFDRQAILLLIGATQVAKHLAEMAQALDYQVVVCDPRELYQQSWSVPEVLVNKSMPDDLIKILITHRRCAIVALAHDPRIDDMGLMEALVSPAFYIAAMGSTKTNEKRRERLSFLGLSAQQIQRLHGPAGIDISSKRPAEIAVSILAELIKTKNSSANDFAKKTSKNKLFQ